MAQAIRPVMLVILDGFGWREATADNAVRLARMPNFTALWPACPHAFLHTSGRDVGLPDGQMGNSEVGHLNIGAGRVVKQELVRIGDAVADGSDRQGRRRSLTSSANTATRHLPPDGPRLPRRRALAPGPRRRASRRSCTTPASRPSCMRSPTAATPRRNPRRLPRPAARRAARRASRSPPSPAATSRWTATNGGTASRRPTPRWPRPRAPAVDDPVEAVQGRLRGREIRRVHPAPSVIGDYAGMKDGDGILCFNFRADRVREILAALLDPGFDGFPREARHQVRCRRSA